MGDVVLKAALDIGSSRVKAILGELSGDGERIRVLGSTEVVSKGVRKSKVEDVETLSECIRTAIEKLEEKTGKSVKKASIGIGGDHLKSVTRNMKFNFSEDEEVVKEAHLDNLYELAEKETLSGESVIKKELYNIRVDNSGILKNPVGIIGGSLEGDVHLITAEKAQLELLVEAVNRAGVGVEEITLNSYASAQAILTQDDKKMGVALADIGEGSTDLIIFKNGKLIYSKSIPIGGMHYVNDLAYMFKMEKSDALKLKKLYNENKVEENIEMKVGEEVRSFSIQSIRGLFDARSGDIVNYLSKALEESGFKGYLGNGVILTGGAVTMAEVVEELAKNLNYKVRVGEPIKIRGMVEALPSYSTVLGILLEVLEKEHFKIKNPEKEVVKEEVKTEEPQEKPKEEIKASEGKEKKAAKPKVEKSGIFDNMKSWIKEFI